MKKFLLFGILIIVLAGFGIFALFSNQDKPSMFNISKTQTQEEAPQDINASFAIFTNGTFRVFSASMYHDLSDDVFISAENPNIVRVKKTGITWGDFFSTLPMEISSQCLTTGTGQTFCSDSTQTLKFYINGELDANALNRIINAGDQLLVSYGEENDSEIENQLNQIPTAE